MKFLTASPFRVFFAVVLVLTAFSFGYIPGESRFVSLDGDHGIFGNPAGVSSIDTKGALLDYQLDDGISDFRIGANLDHLAAGFHYQWMDQDYNEARWNVVHSFSLFGRNLFWGSRLEALRSSEFRGTEWSWDPGFLLRPFTFLSLGAATKNLVYWGPQNQDRMYSFGGTLRLGSIFSTSYDIDFNQNFDTNTQRLLLEFNLYGTRLGFKMPLFGNDDEYTLSLTTSIGSYSDVGITFFDDYLPKHWAWSYHSSRNPNASTFAKIIRIPLGAEIAEVEDDFSFFSKRNIGILKVRNLFEHLYRDLAAGMLILDFSGYKGNLGVSSEINVCINKYKARGGKVIAYTDDIRPAIMVAASSADRIVAEPSSHLNWRGLGGSSIFYKGLFDKLGVKVEFLRHGQYKSAVEPYTMDSMSVEAREDRENLYKNMWKWIRLYSANHVKMHYNGDLEQAYHVLDSVANNPIVTATGAKSVGIIDTVLYMDQVPAYGLETFFGLKVDYARYVTWNPMDKKIFDENWRPRATIALLNIDGSIDSRMEKSVLESLRHFPESGAKALIVRISSPGGSAIASDKIWAALRHISNLGIPVVASIGSVGASGGYYIACGADKIFAEPFSLVGSIGIYGGKVDVSGLMAKVGLRSEVVKTHEHADAESFMRPFSDVEKKALQEYMDDFYNRFTGVVAKATGIPQTVVDSAYGGGRVMVGYDAQKIGLVHQLGNLDDAIAEAKYRAGINSRTDVRLVQINTDNGFVIPSLSAKSFVDYLGEWGKIQLWAVEPSLWGLE
ncbi:MAG: signal peptide peptidase SppA [Fibrobacteraceae bacterium]|nr:signal peptide peptidase SppA [Fibrobacteraceae bacterium]